MSEFIRIEDKNDLFDLIGGGALPEKSIRLLRAAIEDIADHIELEARQNAPIGETGKLSAHPVDRRDLKRRVKGPGGLVVKSVLSIPDKPKYAKWVHDGTGIYGPLKRPITPRRAPFMVFRIDGKLFRVRSVKGQKPQPYLRNAIEDAEKTYIPIKLAELRARLEELK